MVDKSSDSPSIRRQCELLEINRNRLKPPSGKGSLEDQRIIALLDIIHQDNPSFGTRSFKTVLARDFQITVGRKRLKRLMHLACVEAIYQKPRTSHPGKGHKIYPYLLRNVKTKSPNEAWCTDITYIRMAQGYCYLCAIMDWHTRAVLGWSVSNTMDVSLCLDAFEMAQKTSGCNPGIMNTDQGSQFTGEKWIARMKTHKIKVSMDGKGRWVDNVFIERLWRSVKYEDIYLRAYESPREVARGLKEWFEKYNHYRPHSSLGGLTPWACYSPEEKVA